MYYHDGTGVYMAHATFVNDNKVMGSVGSVTDAKKKLNTKYHGGMFLLKENDTISVHVPGKNGYYMTSGESFFGAFLVRALDLEIQGKQVLQMQLS